MYTTSPLFILFILSILLTSCFTSRTSSRLDKVDASEVEFTDTAMKLLKSSTSLFILREVDIKRKAQYEKIFNDIWDFNNVKVVSYKDLKKYANKDYSYFILEGHDTETNNLSTGSSYNNSHFYLTLKYSYFVENRKGDREKVSIDYCRIELFSDLSTMSSVRLLEPEEIIPNLYRQGRFRNFTPGMMKLYLAEVQKALKKSKRNYLFDSFQKEAATQKLCNDTLFMPDYVKYKFNKFSGSEIEQHDLEDLFSSYDCPYAFLEVEELDKRILNNDITYVLDYVKSSTDKFIKVYHVQEGPIYQTYKPMSYNIKSKDLKKIRK